MEETQESRDRQECIERRRARNRRRKRIVIVEYTIIVILAAVMIVLLYLQFSPKDALKGSWAPDLTTIYTFNGKGSGKLKTTISEYEFSYVYQVDILVMDFKDENVTDREFSVAFSDDSDILFLTAADGTVTYMAKQ